MNKLKEWTKNTGVERFEYNPKDDEFLCGIVKGEKVPLFIFTEIGEWLNIAGQELLPAYEKQIEIAEIIVNLLNKELNG